MPLQTTNPKLFYQLVRDNAPYTAYTPLRGYDHHIALWMVPVVIRPASKAGVAALGDEDDERMARRACINDLLEQWFDRQDGARAHSALIPYNWIAGLSPTMVRELLQNIAGVRQDQGLIEADAYADLQPSTAQLSFLVGTVSRVNRQPTFTKHPPETGFPQKLQAAMSLVAGRHLDMRVGTPMPFGTAIRTGLAWWLEEVGCTRQFQMDIGWQNEHTPALELTVMHGDQEPDHPTESGMGALILLPMHLLGHDGVEEILQCAYRACPPLTPDGSMFS